MRRTFSPAALATVFFALAPSAQAAHPWPARRATANPQPAHQLRDVNRWPKEPEVPGPIDAARFRTSVDHMCARSHPAEEKSVEVPPDKALGPMVLAAAEAAAVDPFLLAGLMFEESQCKANLDVPGGLGLLRISPAMYHSPGAPEPPGDAALWTKSALLDPAKNLQLGAQLLKMWMDTHAEHDEEFKGVPHRSGVAHFMWGDVARGSGNEDQAYTARRRLVQTYLQLPNTMAETTFGMPVLSPLEGAPRVASSGPGEDRAGGKRRHMGIDLVAAIGEPVRSIADGTVVFAGANMPGSPKKTLPPDQVNRYRWRKLGPGGIYVCIDHPGAERRVMSCYMHLDTYTVTQGETVKAGQEIGRVGRTGVQVSPPHLHFEIRIDERHVDPSRQLAALCIPPKATQSHRYAIQIQRARMARSKTTRAASEKM